MNSDIATLIDNINQNNLIPRVNLERPIYKQPEDSLIYRSCRILLILATINKEKGLSKELIASLDFLLRNNAYQPRFIVEYFETKVMLTKFYSWKVQQNVENDFYVVQYKSVPWDLRFNNMFMFLAIRGYIETKKTSSSLKIKILTDGMILAEKLKSIFEEEMQFLNLFEGKIIESRTKNIITEVIPNTYWRENEKLVC